MSEETLQIRLLDSCEKGSIDKAKALIEEGADPYWQDTQGQNSLIVASKHGHLSLVQWLLDLGVPWNVQDNQGYCAGDYALQEGHNEVVECLLTAGCHAEMILGHIEKNHMHKQAKDDNDFLSEPVIITQDGKCILDHRGGAVMMEWEAPLMEAHAEALCVCNGDVLNIGFGLGLVDSAMQKRKPKSHTIVEAHPQVYQFMLEKGWDKIPGVEIIHARWQDIVESLPQYDSIFFDTYGEHYSDLQAFHQFLPNLMKLDGIYSFFNGLAPDNAFFHLVYCEIARAELDALGFSTQFVPLPLNVDKEEIWKEVKHRYWWSDSYRLPVAQFTPSSSA